MRQRAVMPVYWLWWLGLLGVISASPLPADPLKDPKRVINGQTVNLTPLFEWWTSQHGSQPLGAWVQLTGEVVGTSAFGWTVEALIQTAPPGGSQTNRTVAHTPVRVILKYPPRQDQAEFEKLVARRQALNNERERLSQSAQTSVQTATNAAGQYDADRPWKLQSRTALDDVAAARAAENNANQQIEAIDGQLAIIARRLQAYPDTNRYRVDCFALATGTTQNGMPVYDYGLVMK